MATVALAPDSIAQLSQEDRLLILCARTHSTADSLDRINALLRGPIDWDVLRRRANDQHLNMLLYPTLKQTAPGSVPPDIADALEQNHRINVRHNTLLAMELLQIAELFETNHIPHVFFKGCTLAVSAYGDLGLRRFGDVDVFLREQDIASARKLLVERRYEHRADDSEELPRWNHHYTLRHAISGLSVELHWQIAPKYYYFPLAFDDVLSRSSMVGLIGGQARSCSPADTLQILCVHAAKHGWTLLCWVTDIAEVLRSEPGLGWDFVMRQTSVLHSRRAVLLGLALAHDLLDAELPAAILDLIHADETIADLVQRAFRRMFAAPGPNDDFENYALQLLIRDSLRDRLIYIRGKQPMMDPAAAEPIASQVAPADRPIYLGLWAIRFARIRVLRPIWTRR